MKLIKINSPLHKHLLFTALCLLAPFGLADNVAAQARDVQSGEVGFEGADKKLSLGDLKISALTYIKGVQSGIEKGAATLPAPSSNDLSYFNAVFLYCMTNNGVCPIPLDALYEIDLINAKAAKKDECPILTKFWRLWLSNGFEERQRYLIKTAFITTTGNFNSQVRPRYIKCAETISTDRAQLEADPKNFSTRYASGGSGREAVSKFLQLLQLIEDNNVDVFSAMGINTADDKKPEVTQKKAR